LIEAPKIIVGFFAFLRFLQKVCLPSKIFKSVVNELPIDKVSYNKLSHKPIEALTKFPFLVLFRIRTFNNEASNLVFVPIVKHRSDFKISEKILFDLHKGSRLFPELK
jgi:hypothetical protein